MSGYRGPGRPPGLMDQKALRGIRRPRGRGGTSERTAHLAPSGTPVFGVLQQGRQSLHPVAPSSPAVLSSTPSRPTPPVVLGTDKPSAPSKPIVLPTPHYLILQERIRQEITNLKYSDIATSVDEEDEDELGSDIQFLPPQKREILVQEASKKRLAAIETESHHANNSSKNSQPERKGSQTEIITIDLTKDSTPPPDSAIDTPNSSINCDKSSEATERTLDFRIGGSQNVSAPPLAVSYEDDYPSLDLDPHPIQWDDGLDLKSRPFIHKNPARNPIIASDLESRSSLLDDVVIRVDRGKLRTETQQVLTAIRSRLGGVLSLEGSEPAAESSPVDEDEELATLRCRSERTEVASERESRRRQRCNDYPGLAFGSSIFSSDTMMKFNIIKNELHNIIKTQLKRVC